MKTLVMICAIFTNTALKAQMLNNFQSRDLNNTLRSYNELKGEKLTAIDFWATWCKPCSKAIPELNKIYNEYQEKGLEIIGISCDGPRSAAKVAPQVKSLEIRYPVLLDINAELMNNLNLQAFPTLILVNTENKIVWIHEGYVSGDAEVIKAEIQKHLNVKD